MMTPVLHVCRCGARECKVCLSPPQALNLKKEGDGAGGRSVSIPQASVLMIMCACVFSVRKWGDKGGLEENIDILIIERLDP